MNNNPNYILKTKEAFYTYLEEKSWFKVLLVILSVTMVALLIGEFLCRGELHAILRWISIVLACITIVIVLCGKIGRKILLPVELQFFDDHLVLYRQKQDVNDSKLIYEEWEVMKYSDVTKCEYQVKWQHIYFYGNGTRFDNSDKTDIKLIYFNTSLITNVDFVKEIEAHSPIKVIMER